MMDGDDTLRRHADEQDVDTPALARKIFGRSALKSVSGDGSDQPIAETQCLGWLDELDSTRAVIAPRVFSKLPILLREAALNFDKGVSRDVFLSALLGTLSAALPKVRTRYGGQSLSPHLFMFIVGPPGSGKGSAGSAFRWLQRIDEMLLRESRTERNEWLEAQEDTDQRSKKGHREREAAPQSVSEKEPPERCLVVAANTTAAALCHRLAANPEGVFMSSTEADTLSSSNHREHGDFSHILRQSFHHERTQVDRRGADTLRIKQPRLAVVLTGTPKQLPRLLRGGIEDGLYSRFAIYHFDEIEPFKPQWPCTADEKYQQLEAGAQATLLDMYSQLRNRKNELVVHIPTEVQHIIDRPYRDIHERTSPSLRAVVNRGMIIAIRIACVLSVLRSAEHGEDLTRVDAISATKQDVALASQLASVYTEHSLRAAHSLSPDGTGSARAEVGTRRYSENQSRFERLLPSHFTTEAARQIAGAHGFAWKSCERWLTRLVEDGTLQKSGRGSYFRPVGADSGQRNQDVTTDPGRNEMPDSAPEGMRV